ncbi:hypothetical protein LSTR_LSTR013385 [Laodelphax striatellus]|uniref:MADF domain-containing protein n=1 Tax=Laodelphax striatellus TaxID=195883 RepID=A0A482WSL8_LAOST|nr:hypothetical protein LSTR_LSTR013385 [Laodelphax striatellus]
MREPCCSVVACNAGWGLVLWVPNTSTAGPDLILPHMWASRYFNSSSALDIADAEILITLVQQKPDIWDKCDENIKDRIKIKAAWRDIVPNSMKTMTVGVISSKTNLLLPTQTLAVHFNYLELLNRSLCMDQRTEQNTHQPLLGQSVSLKATKPSLYYQRKALFMVLKRKQPRTN